MLIAKPCMFCGPTPCRCHPYDNHHKHKPKLKKPSEIIAWCEERNYILTEKGWISPNPGIYPHLYFGKLMELATGGYHKDWWE